MKINKQKAHIATYSDKLLQDSKFREAFEKEYENLVISEKIAELRHKAHLTQEELAKKVSTTKSAICRYESNEYQGYSVSLLKKIASACGADLQISFKTRKTSVAVV
jgi:DNA-binding XRE family transcriptional regulator